MKQIKRINKLSINAESFKTKAKLKKAFGKILTPEQIDEAWEEVKKANGKN